MRTVLALCLAASSGLGATLADIMPIPGSQRVRPIFDSSDIVCFCRIKSVDVSATPIPTTPADHSTMALRKIRFVVEVSDSYRRPNDLSEPIVAEVEDTVPSASANSSPFKPGRSFLLFLKWNPQGFFSLTDPFLGATPFNAVPNRVPTNGFDELQDALSTIAVGPEQDDQLRALHLLEGFDALDQHTIQAARSLTNQTNQEIAAAAVALLLNTKTPDSLQTLTTFLQKYKGDYHSWAFINIDSALAQFRDPLDLPSLATLSKSDSTSVRDGAVRALRGIRSLEAVPALVERLDDGDSTIRYLSVIALAETLGKYDGDFAPSMYLFDRRPEYYTDLWKRWWADKGSKLYPRTSSIQ